MADRAAAELATLATRYGLGDTTVAGLESLLSALVGDPHAPTSVRDPVLVVRDHLADALVALEVDAVRGAGTLLDLGSGAGVPGLPLALACPAMSVSLVEAAGRKCAFLRQVVAGLGLAPRVTVVHARAEELGSPDVDVVTVRAVASLAVIAEYAAPLLRVGGTLVAWRGARDPEAELEGQKAAAILGLELGSVIQVRPYSRAENRFLHLMSKVRVTPDRFPRRPGMAVKRPLGRD